MILYRLMASRPHSRQAPQPPKAHTTQTATACDILAIRRSVSPESYPVFENIAELLEPEIRNAARLFDISNLGVTVIGFTRFDKHHRQNWPPTREVVGTVHSAREPLEVKLGTLGVYGSDSKHKLGFSLESDALIAEISAFEQTFRDRGSPLRNDPNANPDELTPHCSIALLYEENVGYFCDTRTLDRLNAFILEAIVKAPILLNATF